VYLAYGDTRILESQYESMRGWVEYMRRLAGDDLILDSGFHFGDWLAFHSTRADYPGATTDKDLIATAFFAHSTSLLARTAPVLGASGHLDDAYALLLREQYPSWLYPIKQGATTIWERWDGEKPDSSFQDPEMNSFNHYAYGAVGAWLYTTVAGIEIDPERPG